MCTNTARLCFVPRRLRRPTLKLENAGHRSEKTGEYNKFATANLCTQNPVGFVVPRSLLRLGSQFSGIFFIFKQRFEVILSHCLAPHNSTLGLARGILWLLLTGSPYPLLVSALF